MRKPKTHNLLMTTLLVLLSSCNTSSLDTEQCSPEFKVIEGTDHISISESICRCRDYRFKIDHVGPINAKVVRHPIMYCQKMFGFTSKKYSEVASFWEEVRKEIADAQVRSKKK